NQQPNTQAPNHPFFVQHKSNEANYYANQPLHPNMNNHKMRNNMMNNCKLSYAIIKCICIVCNCCVNVCQGYGKAPVGPRFRNGSSPCPGPGAPPSSGPTSIISKDELS